MRVLVIDNEPATLIAVSALLARAFGHEVRTANGGREGLAVARQWRPDVILCDLSMPAVDGFQVGLEVTTDQALDGVRLLALSGYDDAARRFAAEQAGFEQFISKPASGIELDRAIRGEQGGLGENEG